MVDFHLEYGSIKDYTIKVTLQKVFDKNLSKKVEKKTHEVFKIIQQFLIKE